MFRGLTRQEHGFLLFVIGLLVGGLAVGYLLQPKDDRENVSFSGPVIEHEDGSLLLPDVRDPNGNGIVEESDSSILNGRININTADVDLLVNLPGIGPSKAEAIVRSRSQMGPFLSIQSLDRVAGIGEKTIEGMSNLVTVGDVAETATHLVVPVPTSALAAAENTQPAAQPGGLPSIVNINKASVEELETLDGIGPAFAQRIVDYRARNGPFRHITDIQKVKGIGPATLEKNRHRLAVH